MIEYMNKLFATTNNPLLHNKYLLYLALIFAIAYAYVLAIGNEYSALAIFGLAIVLFSYMTKNMVVVITLSLLVTFLATNGVRALEGFSADAADAADATEDNEATEEKQREELQTVSTTDGAPTHGVAQKIDTDYKKRFADVTQPPIDDTPDMIGKMGNIDPLMATVENFKSMFRN